MRDLYNYSLTSDEDCCLMMMLEFFEDLGLPDDFDADDHLGVWEACDEDDLIEEITTSSGWCIKSIDYDIQLK